MDNGISQRQNEEKSIMMLAAQRQLYSDAKVLDSLGITLSVIIPFVMSFVLLFVSGNSTIVTTSYLVTIISAVISFLVDGIVSKKKELAASIQQKFDTYVYAMPWDSRIFGKEKAFNNEIAQYSKKIMSDPQKKATLYNWYTPIVDSRSLYDGILFCQRENIWWDVGLRKRFKAASIIIIIAMCVIIFGMGIYQNESVVRLLSRFAFVAPMIEWLLGTVKQINEDIDSLNELDDCVREKHVRTMEELQDIQKLLFNHRKKCLSIPNVFYAIFKDNDEDRARHTAEIDN